MYNIDIVVRRKNKKNRIFKLSLRKMLALLIFYTALMFSIIVYSEVTKVKDPTFDYKKLVMNELPKGIKKEVLSLADSSVSSASSEFKIPILLYHYIEYVQDKNDTIRQSLNITPYIFEKQIETLSQAGYSFLTVSDIAEIIDGKKKMPSKAAALSFDDGYRDFYTDVFPILKKHKIKATVYVVPYFIDKSNFMFASQIREVIDSKLIELGAHTMHHLYLKGISSSKAWEEINESRIELENKFNVNVVSFAYPYGAFDQQTISFVKNAGFKTAVSTIPGIIGSKRNRYYLYRLRPGYRTGEELLKYITN